MRVSVHQWKLLMMLSRLELIEMMNEAAFGQDGKVGVSVKVNTRRV